MKKKWFRLLLTGAVMFMLSACGKTGPLTLPDEGQSSQQSA